MEGSQGNEESQWLTAQGMSTLPVSCSFASLPSAMSTTTSASYLFRHTVECVRIEASQSGVKALTEAGQG
jgi:hypothetical protein